MDNVPNMCYSCMGDIYKNTRTCGLDRRQTVRIINLYLSTWAVIGMEPAGHPVTSADGANMIYLNSNDVALAKPSFLTTEFEKSSPG